MSHVQLKGTIGAGILDFGQEAIPGDGVGIPEEIMFGAAPTLLAFGAQDTAIRGVRVTDQMRAYPLQKQNREYLYEMGTIMGHVAFDTQNPYVWASKGVLAYDVNGPNSKLFASYGIASDTAKNVALNAQATAGIFDLGTA